MKLRLRLSLLLMLPLLLVIGVYSAMRVQQEVWETVEGQRNRAAGMARTMQIAVTSALTIRDRPQAELVNLLNDLTVGQPSVEGMRILDRDGHVVAASNARPTTYPTASSDLLTRARETGTGKLVETRSDGEAFWVYVLPVQLQGAKRLSVPASAQKELEIVFAAPDIRKMARQAIHDVLLRVGALTAVLVLLIAVVLQRQILRPLANLTHSIRALGEGRPASPLPVKRHDELGEMAEAFNRMTERLEEARQRLVAEAEYTLDLEQQLRRTQTLAVAGKLVSGIAHEVGTPLNIVSGRAELVLRSLPPGHAGRQDLERIIHQIDRVSNIVRSLLDTVRVGKLDVQRVSVESLIGRLLPLIEHLVRKRRISMTTSIPPDLPSVAGDLGRLQQVFINLLMNAVEASPPDGLISITAWSSSREGRAGVTTEVTDTGTGIPHHALEQVFEPFYTTKPVGEGTGLGLAISRDIIREHGGTIVARSDPGHGSSFVVWLPQHESLS